jgi:hypothetical protein
LDLSPHLSLEWHFVALSATDQQTNRPTDQQTHSEISNGQYGGAAAKLATILVTVREKHYRRYSLMKAGWWSRLFVAAVFAFYLNYIPVHLATATHLDDLLESVAEAVLHHDGHDDADHSHDSDHHVPHPASDHTLTLITQTLSSNDVVTAVCLLPVDTSVLFCEPEAPLPAPVFDRIWPPGESPPGPLQPRAPPLA